MALTSTANIPRSQLAERQVSRGEYRRYQRFALKLTGRLMTGTGQEVPCETIDISAGGLAIKTAARVDRGEQIVLYLDLLGRVEGTSVRQLPEGLAVELKMPAGRDKRLHEKLAFLNRQKMPTGQIRLHERIVPDDPSTNVTIGSLSIPAEVIDFSRRGAKLRLPMRLNVGAALMVGGSIRAYVVQVSENTAGVEFTRLLPIEGFDASFRF
jgi:hypothetical protein